MGIEVEVIGKSHLLLVGIGDAIAVGLGVPAVELIALAGESVGGERFTGVFGDGLGIAVAACTVRIEGYGVSVGDDFNANAFIQLDGFL